MAYGIEDYERDDAGGYTFRKSDGSMVHAAGPEADLMAQEIDRTKGAATNTDVGRINWAMNNPAPPRPPGAPPAPTPQMPEPAALPGMTEARVTPVREPQDPNAIRQQQMAQAINAPVYMPGRAGYDPEKVRQTGSYVQTGKTTTREGMGEPLTDEMLNRKRELEMASDEATRARMSEESSRATLNAIKMDMDAEETRSQVEEQRRIRDEAGRRAAATWDNVVQTEQAAREGKIQPNKFFSDLGTWGTIGAAIAQGLGAYGASLGGGQNYAQQIINAAIDRDIMAQKEELITKKDAARNALAMRRDAVGDLDVAEKILREEMLRLADVERQSFAAASGAAIAPQLQAEWDAARAEQRATAEQQFKDERIGREVENVAYQFRTPVAATAGGYRAPSLKEQAARAGYLKTINEAGEAIDGGGKADPKDVRSYAEKKKDYAAAIQSMRDLGKEMNLKPNPDGSVTAPEDWDGISGHGWSGGLSDWLMSDEGMAVRQSMLQATGKGLKAESGGQVTDQERELYMKASFGKTDEDAKRGFAKRWESLLTEANAVDAMASDAEKREYERRVKRDTVDVGSKTRLQTQGGRDF